jgi:hypothetical protein
MDRLDIVTLSDVALRSQILEVLVHGRERSISEALGDLLEAGRVPVGRREFRDEVEDLSLLPGQRLLLVLRAHGHLRRKSETVCTEHATEAQGAFRAVEAEGRG